VFLSVNAISYHSIPKSIILGTIVMDWLNKQHSDTNDMLVQVPGVVPSLSGMDMEAEDKLPPDNKLTNRRVGLEAAQTGTVHSISSPSSISSDSLYQAQASIHRCAARLH
jgi:hypothetical protein